MTVQKLVGGCLWFLAVTAVYVVILFVIAVIEAM